jgi:hypothetical protein
VADGADARDGPGQAVRPVPRAGAARVRRAARAVGHRAPAAHRRGRHRHRVHGDGRAVAEESARPALPRPLRRHPPHLLDHDVRVAALPALPLPQLQLHLRRLRRRRRHVAHLLHDRLRHLHRQGRPPGHRRLLDTRHHHGRPGVRRAQRPRRRHVRVRGPQRRAGDPGHHPVHAGGALQEAHVARGRRGLRHRRALLLLRRLLGLLRLRQLGRAQRAHVAREAALAHRRRQLHGLPPRRRELPGLRHARLRHDRDRARQEAQVPAKLLAPPRRALVLRRRHHVRRDDLPLLRRPARILRRIRVRADHILRKKLKSLSPPLFDGSSKNLDRFPD